MRDGTFILRSEPIYSLWDNLGLCRAVRDTVEEYDASLAAKVDAIQGQLVEVEDVLAKVEADKRSEKEEAEG